MSNNPYSLTFGREPAEMIDRSLQAMEIRNAFLSTPSPQQVYMITGVRGSGKTVFMSHLAGFFAEMDNWIVVELNPNRDILEGLAAKLASEKPLAELFQHARINLSFFNFGLSIQGEPPIRDIETALERMLLSLKKAGKRLLITIDEVTSNPYMVVFASSYQIFLRHELPVYLLMTGLFENMNALQNVDNLTFLHRAPKIFMTPLHLATISSNYKRNLQVSDTKAQKMAAFTKGYSFAFQLLGYYAWEYGPEDPRVKESFRQILDESVYEKIWSELSRKDKQVAFGIAKAISHKTKEICDLCKMQGNELSIYRLRLSRRGILDTSEYGYIRFSLPCFKDFVLDQEAFYFEE